MTTLHSQNFYDILNDFFKADQASSDSPLALATATQADKLVCLYHSKSSIFAKEQKFQLQTWYLLYSVKNSLCCDDSFRFSKACQVLAELFDCVDMFPPVVTVDYTPMGDALLDKKEEIGLIGEVGASPRRARVAATLTCLAAALPLYPRSLWSRQPLDKLFSTVTHRRLQLPPDQREQLDELSTTITLARRKAVSGRPAQTVRELNSTAHPLKTKKVGLLR